jgi:hypothetical protein
MGDTRRNSVSDKGTFCNKSFKRLKCYLIYERILPPRLKLHVTRRKLWRISLVFYSMLVSFSFWKGEEGLDSSSEYYLGKRHILQCVQDSQLGFNWITVGYAQLTRRPTAH